MILHDVECEDCGVNEALLDRDELDSPPCPVCGKVGKIVITKMNFQFGGSFYNRGEIKRAEIVHTDENGKQTVYKDLARYFDNSTVGKAIKKKRGKK